MEGLKEIRIPLFPIRLYKDQIAPPKFEFSSIEDSDGANSIEYEFEEVISFIIFASSIVLHDSSGRSIWVHCSVHFESAEIKENKLIE